MRIEVPFANQIGESSVEQNSRETLVNMYADAQVSGRKQVMIRQRAGVVMTLANTGEKRCIERNKGVHYLVIDNKFYSFNGISLIEIGTLSTSTGRCTMIFSDNEDVMVSDGVNGYNWDGTTFSNIASPVHIGALDYQGGFGIFNEPDSGRFYITAVNNFTSIDDLDFASAESSSDNLVRVFVDHNELWLFGATSTEIWQLSGAADFPFSRLNSAQIEHGCAAAFSVAAEDNTVFWLSDDGLFYRANGYQPVIISNGPIDRLIETLTTAERATGDAFCYTNEGNKFYTITFPGKLTLQYNIKTGVWNRCETFGNPDWLIRGSAGRITDYQMTPTGIVSLKSGVSTDEGGILERRAVCPPVHSDGLQLTCHAFFLDAEMGRGAIGLPSQIMMRVARDGETFANERWRNLGPIGAYIRRAVWRNLGVGREFSFEFKMTDPVEMSIVAGYVEATGSSV